MDVKLLDFNGSKVLTYGQIAITAKTSVETLRVSFTRHKKDFVEGKDFIVLSGHDLRSFFDEHGNEMPEKIETTRKLYLWTRIGSRKLLSFLRSTKKQQAEEAVKVEAESKKNEVAVADAVASQSKSPLSRIEYNGEPVLTTSQLADIYGCNQTNLIKNFNMHKSKFQEGIHFYLLNGEKLQHFKNYITESNVVNPHTRSLYLWTERGASRHCMIVDTDRAWQWFDVLEDTYFNIKDGNYRIQDMRKVTDKSNDAEEWKEIILQYLDINQKLINALLDMSIHPKTVNERFMMSEENKSPYINKAMNDNSSTMNIAYSLKEVNNPHIEDQIDKSITERIDDSKRLRQIKAIIDKSSSNDRTRHYYRGGYGLLYDVVSQKLGRDLINEFNIYKRTGSKNKIHYFVEDLGLSKILLETAQELFE